MYGHNNKRNFDRSADSDNLVVVHVNRPGISRPAVKGCSETYDHCRELWGKVWTNKATRSSARYAMYYREDGTKCHDLPYGDFKVWCASNNAVHVYPDKEAAANIPEPCDQPSRAFATLLHDVRQCSRAQQMEIIAALNYEPASPVRSILTKCVQAEVSGVRGTKQITKDSEVYCIVVAKESKND